MGKINIFHLGTEDGGIGEILNCLHCNLALLNTMGQDRCGLSSSELVMPIQASIETLGTNGGASFHGASSLFPEMPSFDHEDSGEIRRETYTSSLRSQTRGAAAGGAEAGGGGGAKGGEAAGGGTTWRGASGGEGAAGGATGRGASGGGNAGEGAGGGGKIGGRRALRLDII